MHCSPLKDRHGLAPRADEQWTLHVAVANDADTSAQLVRIFAARNIAELLQLLMQLPVLLQASTCAHAQRGVMVVQAVYRDVQGCAVGASGRSLSAAQIACAQIACWVPNPMSA